MHKRTFLQLASASAVAVLVGGSASAQTSGLRKITIAAAGELMQYLPFYVGRAANHFREEGLEVDWVNLHSGSLNAAAVMSGSSEFAPIGLLHVIKAVSEGGNLLAIASTFSTLAVELVLSSDALKKSGITEQMPIDEKVKRLKGLRIAVSTPGSTTDLFVRATLIARNLDPKMLEIQSVGNGPAMMAAFEKGVVDGFVWPPPFPQMVEMKGLGKIVISPFKAEVPELIPVVNVIMAATQQTVAKDPKLVHAATRAITKALKFVHERPQETRQLTRKYFPDLDEGLFNRLVEVHRSGTAKSPIISPENVQKTAAWVNLVLPTKPPEYKTVVAPEFAERAAKELL